MELDPNQLPDDPKLLRDVISQLLGAVARLERKNAWLQAGVEALFRKLFRKHSEKLDPRQLELVFEAMRDLWISQQQLETLENEVASPPNRRQGRPVRRPLPKDMPRERVEHALPEAERCCGACGAELTKIREEVTEQLDYTPASFKIIEHVRGVFACKGCEETITRAPKPPQAIEKGLPGPGLLAQVMVSKYSDHRVSRTRQGVMQAWCCTRDEGRPLGSGDQEPDPNHRELLSLRAMVVNVAETAEQDSVR
jgi:transposase